MTNPASSSHNDETVLGHRCPSTPLLRHVSGKWALETIATLRQAPLRTHALQRSLQGISPKVLSQTLRELERVGLVEREEFDTAARHVEYRLTELGRSLSATLTSLDAWVGEHARHLPLGAKY